MKQVYSLNRSGFASIDDLRDKTWQTIFDELEIKQSVFLGHRKIIFPHGYNWPIDPLHTWSRCWEYPYVYFHLKSWISEYSIKNPKIVDIGPGITFFPFAIADQNNQVIALDIDPMVCFGLRKARALMGIKAEHLKLKYYHSEKIPIVDNSIDVVYCISVLEHVTSPETLIQEISRILRKNGLFILTFDVDLKGNSEIGPLKYNQMLAIINANFNWRTVERNIHPLRIITTRRSIFPLKSRKFNVISNIIFFPWKFLIQKILKNTRIYTVSILNKNAQKNSKIETNTKSKSRNSFIIVKIFKNVYNAIKIALKIKFFKTPAKFLAQPLFSNRFEEVLIACQGFVLSKK